jgi:hypothetical protein
MKFWCGAGYLGFKPGSASADGNKFGCTGLDRVEGKRLGLGRYFWRRIDRRIGTYMQRHKDRSGDKIWPGRNAKRDE